MERCVHELVAEQAARRPDAVALRFGEERRRYGELDRAASRLARRLTGAGLGRGGVVAVLLERGPGLVVAALAVLKAAGAYSLFDPEFPPARLETMLAETGARILLTDKSLSGYCDTGRYGATEILVDDEAPTQDSGLAALPNARPADAACVMFTSGSTGRPKGVLAPHRALSAAVTGTDYCHITPDDVVLQASQVSWDVFAQELWGALANGATCVLQPGQRPDPARIAELVERHGVTVMYAAASLFNHLVDFHPAVVRTVEQVMTGGEPLSTGHVRRALAAHPALRLVNGYGPVETMILSTCHPVTAGDLDRAAIPLGTAFPGDTFYVLDDGLGPVPPGAEGEIYLGGVGVAHGYIGRGAATCERFVADPFAGPGDRMYRTGDLGRLTPDGVLEYRGRRDRQLKLRGMRIEPGEIETVLVARPELAQAAVQAVDGTLVAYVVPVSPDSGLDDSGGAADPARLREHCRGLLPDHMVPQLFVVLSALPLSPSGKLDRAALPLPERARRAGGREAATDLERRLCALFAQVLGVEEVGVEEGFFELGGHSLTATRLAGQIRAELGREVDLRQLFATPTVAGLARHLETDTPVAGPRQLTKIGTRPRPWEALPLPDAARRLWLLDRMAPGPAYNIPVLIRLRGPLDAELLRAAVGDLVERHEILRTCFPDVNGEPAMVLTVPEAAFALPHVSCEERDLPGQVLHSAQQPFDIRADAPFRATLFRIATDDHALLLVIHHIACDGWSLRPLLRDLGAAFAARREGRTPEGAPPAVQYADFTLWQREHAAARSRDLAAQLEYWREALAATPEPSIDLPRPASPTDQAERRAEIVSLRLGADSCEQIRRFTREHDSTLFMTLHTALNALLTRYGAGTDIAVGTVTAGRDDPDLDSAVGFFVNTLVLRTRTDGDPGFAELLRRSRETQFAAFAHQEVPFDRVVSALRPARAAGRTPFFGTMLVLQNNLAAELDLADLATGVSMPKIGTAKFDLVFEVTEIRGPQGADELVIDLEFAADRFDPAAAQGLLHGFACLLESGAASPDTSISALPLTTAARPVGHPPVQPPAASFIDLFTECARRTPEADAVVYGPVCWSYAEVEARSDALAARLRTRGVGTESIIASLLPKCADAPVAFLAVLKAGGAFLPLDPDGPQTRAKFTIADAGAALVLALRENAEQAAGLGIDVIVLDDESAAGAAPDSSDAPATQVSAHDLAYVIYTSGSTGVPKGVAVEHGTLANLADATRQALGLTGRDRVLQWASHTFDASIWDLVMALTSGAALHIAAAHERVGPELAARLRESAITAALVTPSALASLPDDPASLPDLSTLILGGEAVPRALAGRWAPGRRLLNAYGPTEITVCATACDLEADGPVSIGRPLDRVRAYVLDERFEPVPAGTRGEIYVGGAGVARGYLDRPALTAERFVPDPFAAAGSRMYRTGDLGRLAADGRLEFLGRGDDQVKIRGFRIELGEIESALAAHPAVGRAAVLAHRFPDEQVPRLVAYFDPPAVAAEPDLAHAGPASDSALRHWLSERLPPYMVPALFVRLAALPTSAAGKIDRGALPPPEPALTRPEAAEGARVPPRTPTELLIAQAWADLLHLPAAQLGIHEDFFTLGGDSLGAVRLAARLESTAGRPLGAAQIFRTPTLAGLAAYLDAPGPSADDAPPAFAAIPRLSRRPRPPVSAA